MEQQQTLIEAVKAAAKERDGRRVMPCATAFQLAEQFSVTVREIGDICNAEGIKIANCQLGCF